MVFGSRAQLKMDAMEKKGYKNCITHCITFSGQSFTIEGSSFTIEGISFTIEGILFTELAKG